MLPSLAVRNGLGTLANIPLTYVTSRELVKGRIISTFLSFSGYRCRNDVNGIAGSRDVRIAIVGLAWESVWSSSKLMVLFPNIEDLSGPFGKKKLEMMLLFLFCSTGRPATEHLVLPGYRELVRVSI